MRRAMARTRDWTCLKHITWTINNEYKALWNLPYPETTLKRYGSLPSASPAAPASGVRAYGKGVYKQEQKDGAEDVLGAGNTTNAAKNDAVGEEMRVDSFVKHEIEETDGDGLVEKAKKGVKKVGEKMKDASDYMRTGAEKAEEKEGSHSTMQQMMDKAADLLDGAGDTMKEAGSKNNR
ncbi:hypothetical protein MPTK1_2g15320 [Marchantia polymorpha subsp. ruderalis]|nr:hypothetical protein MARPO_0082s0030 [Marchantia polymorpha]BBN02431.1 hypothetical protein Mp_2g15320 [Marchantia polymorpha subsp. ruderalis]|eukprot:PTQ34179.1 hypothetical protein MARPO_0082s0030 [Marchantia polymorpha]